MTLRPQAAPPQTKERALQLARERLRARPPAASARCAGVDYTPSPAGGGLFVAQFLHERWRITYPDGLVARQDTGSPAKEAVSLLLLHYLGHADGSPLAGLVFDCLHE